MTNDTRTSTLAHIRYHLVRAPHRTCMARDLRRRVVCSRQGRVSVCFRSFTCLNAASCTLLVLRAPLVAQYNNVLIGLDPEQRTFSVAGCYNWQLNRGANWFELEEHLMKGVHKQALQHAKWKIHGFTQSSRTMTHRRLRKVPLTLPVKGIPPVFAWNPACDLIRKSACSIACARSVKIEVLDTLIGVEATETETPIARLPFVYLPGCGELHGVGGVERLLCCSDQGLPTTVRLHGAVDRQARSCGSSGKNSTPRSGDVFVYRPGSRHRVPELHGSLRRNAQVMLRLLRLPSAF